jgi:UDP-N-acetylmuramoylalanine--D-glutamate ligase
MSANKPRLAILGAAESGVGAAVLGLQQGWDVFVSDYGSIREPFKQKLLQHGIEFEEGGHTAAKILNAACIVKSPGISEKTAIMKQVREAGIEVCSEIEFGFRYKGGSKIIAITGSNGKSTTTMLTFHILNKAGLDVALAGNIGYSFALQVAEQPKDWYVIEVSSFQLDDIHSFRPDVAVLLNITPDHLDRYNYVFENYIASKFRITRNQLGTDYFIVNQDDPVMRAHMATHSTHAKIIYFTMNEHNIEDTGGHNAGDDGAFIRNERLYIQYNGGRTEMSVNDLSLSGKHNQYNSMAAGITARIAGVRQGKLREFFEGFAGLDHRLEFVARVRGVEFINDSKATNINSVWYALESMKKPTILILGGQDKGNDYSEIAEMVKEKVKAIICLGVDNSPIHEAFYGLVETIVDTKSAIEAVQAAYSFADSGDVVLLSPGCASFDRFNNFEDRGEQFKNAVRNL